MNVYAILPDVDKLGPTILPEAPEPGLTPLPRRPVKKVYPVQTSAPVQNLPQFRRFIGQPPAPTPKHKASMPYIG